MKNRCRCEDFLHLSKMRIDRLKEWVDRNLQQEVWTHQFDICFQLPIHKMEATILLFISASYGLANICCNQKATLSLHRLIVHLPYSKPSALYFLFLWQEPRMYTS